jgi:hypothetical protein
VVAERVKAGVRCQEPVDLADLAPLPDFVLVEREREEEVCRWDSLRMFSEEVLSLSPSTLRPAGRRCSGAPTLHSAAPAAAAAGAGPASARRAAPRAGGAAAPAPRHLPAEGHGAGGGGRPAPARPAQQGAPAATAAPGGRHQVQSRAMESCPATPHDRGSLTCAGLRGRRATSTPAWWRRPTGQWRGRRCRAGCLRRPRCPSRGSGSGSTGIPTPPSARGRS